MDNNIVVILYDEAGKAALAYEELEALEKEGKILIEDAVIATREAEGEHMSLPAEQTGTFAESVPQPTGALDETHVKITQTHSHSRKRAVAGGGVGLLAGVLLGGPIVGLAAGAAIGAISEHMRDIGLNDKDVHAIADHLQPGTSALFILGHAEDQEAVLEYLSITKAKLVSTTLSEDQAEIVREALAKEA